MIKYMLVYLPTAIEVKYCRNSVDRNSQLYNVNAGRFKNKQDILAILQTRDCYLREDGLPIYPTNDQKKYLKTCEPVPKYLLEVIEVDNV